MHIKHLYRRPLKLFFKQESQLTPEIDNTTSKVFVSLYIKKQNINWLKWSNLKLEKRKCLRFSQRNFSDNSIAQFLIIITHLHGDSFSPQNVAEIITSWHQVYCYYLRYLYYYSKISSTTYNTQKYKIFNKNFQANLTQPGHNDVT